MSRTKFKIEIPNNVKLIHEIFSKHGITLYIVGGACRDALLNIPPKDYDLVSEATPDRVIQLLESQSFIKNIILTGKSFGVINVITIDDEEYEIATFREDSIENDGRRPESVKFCDITTDCLRRDIRFNALYYDLLTNEIIDLVGGIDDLKNNIIRTVGKAEDRFNEDRLRILRVIRFSARFDSELHPDIHHTLKKDNRLSGFPVIKFGEVISATSNISSERIRDEFLKGIKSAKSVKHFLDLLKEYKLLSYIFKSLFIDYNFIEERDYIVLISYILRENTIDFLQKKLNSLNYTIDEVKMIKFLINLKSLNSSNSYNFKKQQNNCYITDEQILKYGKLINISENLLNTFVNYKLTITGEYIMEKYNIKQGAEVGKHIEQLENQLFKELLEK